MDSPKLDFSSLRKSLMEAAGIGPLIVIEGAVDKIKEKIWYPFFTTKKKGTGMGLAIIRKIINSLNGDIALVESGSRGATFKITFYS